MNQRDGTSDEAGFEIPGGGKVEFAETPQTSPDSIDRRNFLKKGAFVAGAVALGGGVSSRSWGKPSRRYGPIFTKSGKPWAGITLNVYADDNPQGTGLQPLVKQFESETGIKVNYEVISELSIVDKAEISLAAGNGSLDITWGGLSEKSAWVSAGWVEPIDSYLTDTSIVGKGFNTSDFVPACWKGTESAGVHYGLPTQMDTNFLMYRKDILSSHGVKVPTTIDEMLTACKKVNHKPVPAITLRGIRGVHSNIWIFNIFYYGEGGTYYKGQHPGGAVPTGKLQADMNTAASLKGMETFADFFLDGYTPAGSGNYDYPETSSTFKSGKAAMFVDDVVFGIEMAAALGDKVGFAPAPIGPSGMYPGFDAQMYFLAKGSNNKEAAVAFMAWATSTPIQLAAAKNGSYVGVTRDSVFNAPAFQKLIRPDLVTAFKGVEAHLDINHFPQTASFNVVGDYMSIAVNEVITGTAKAKSALASAQSQAVSYLAAHQS